MLRRLDSQTKAQLVALGFAIREARKGANMTQAELGDACGIDESHISRIERGRVNVSFDNINRIARSLKLRPSWLLDKAGL